MEVVKVMLTLLKSCSILSLQLALSSHGFMILIRDCLLSPHQTQQVHYTAHVRRFNVTFPVLQITFSLFVLSCVMQVYPLQSKYGLEMRDEKSSSWTPVKVNYMAIRATPLLQSWRRADKHLAPLPQDPSPRHLRQLTLLPAPNFTWLSSRYGTQLTPTAEVLIHSRTALVLSVFCSTANLERENKSCILCIVLHLVNIDLLVWIKIPLL